MHVGEEEGRGDLIVACVCVCMYFKLKVNSIKMLFHLC